MQIKSIEQKRTDNFFFFKYSLQMNRPEKAKVGGPFRKFPLSFSSTNPLLWEVHEKPSRLSTDATWSDSLIGSVGAKEDLFYISRYHTQDKT